MLPQKGTFLCCVDSGGPDDDKCFACVYSRSGAFSAVLNSLPAALIAAILEAKIALAGAEGETRYIWRPVATLPQGRQIDTRRTDGHRRAQIRVAAGTSARRNSA